MKKFTKLDEDLLKENAETAKHFDIHYKSALEKIDKIKIALDDMAIKAKEPDWGFVGSMEHVCEELDNVLEFLGLNTSNPNPFYNDEIADFGKNMFPGFQKFPNSQHHYTKK